MAITKNESLISSQSYTNKDFETIYVELLDLVKKETSKWDPSASNESDPGVLLLKLNALIADKCNYNIDKNVLECFPVSVTQLRNARQLFEQLGYYMHWYNAASTNVSITYKGETIYDSDGNKLELNYTIPRFTMVCDENSENIYTIIEEKNLSTSGTTTSFSALQGTAVQYSINGSTLITVDMLDSDNRLYFDATNIAENGIFITNTDYVNYNEWHKVDNLYTEELSASNLCYKFGVSQSLTNCYIEFPSNAEEIIGDGINITYIVTDGSSGMIVANTLTSLYGDLNVVDPEDNTKTKLLTTDSISINNLASILGKDYETIDDAYINYKKTVGTFNTLITLRDYFNAIYNSLYVSNCIVSDRTNDIQSCYNIMSRSISNYDQVLSYIDKNIVEGYYYNNKFYKDSSHTIEIEMEFKLTYKDIPSGNTYVVVKLSGTKSYVRSDELDDKAIGPFDLKMYLLNVSELMQTGAQYNNTFTLNLNDYIEMIVEAELEDYECTQHEFISLLENKICFIKNKYPLNCTIIPQYILTDVQKNEVYTNIKIALYNKFNSAKVDFGNEIVYEDIYNTILDADNRIKTLSLQPIEYTTYAVYFEDMNGTKIAKEVDITNPVYSNGSYDTSSVTNKFREEIYAKCVLAGKTQFYIQDATFGFSLNKKYVDLKNHIGRIDTNISKTFDSSNNWEQTLGSNEVIQLYSPNLIDYNEYSTYVRFEYSFINNASLAANTPYQLSAGEYMIMYMDNNDTSTGYTYHVYGQGAIIKSSFELTHSKAVADLAGNCVLNQVHDTTIGTFTFKFASGYSADVSSEFTTAIGNITESYYVLTDSRKLYSMVTNSIALTSGKYLCYWILNEKQDDKYVLFEAGQNNRLLKSGEYFIYLANGSMDANILGEGTTIVKSGFNESLSCTAVDYSTFVQLGINAIYDYMINLPSTCTLTITENKYLAFGAGTVVSIKPSPAAAITINSTSATSLQNCAIKYKVNASSSWIDVPTSILSSADASWKALSLLRFSASNDSPQQLATGQSITYYTYDIVNGRIVTLNDSSLYPSVEVTQELSAGTGNKVDTEYIDYGEYTSGGATYDGLVKHADLSADTYVMIATTEAAHTITTNGSTLYNAVAGDILYYKYDQFNDIKPHTLSNAGYVYTSKYIEGIGNNISTLEYDENDEINLISIYTCVDGAVTSNINVTQSGTSLITYSGSSLTDDAIFSFRLPKGKYIIPVQTMPSNYLTSIYAYISVDNGSTWTQLTSMSGNMTNFNTESIKYISLTLTDEIASTSVFKLKFTATSTATGAQPSTVVYNIAKYSTPTTLDPTEMSRIIAKIKSLDYDDVFNYAYVVDDDDKIENPFLPINFLNVNHPYNKVTICQLDTSSNSSYYIMNNIRG